MDFTEYLSLQFRDLTKHHSCTYNWHKVDAEPHKHEDFYELGLVSQGSYLQHFGGKDIVFEGIVDPYITASVEREHIGEKDGVVLFHFFGE